MKILFIADGRSPITMNWLKYFIGSRFEIHLVSTYPCDPPSGLASFNIIPVAFSSMVRGIQILSENELIDMDNRNRADWLRRIVPVQTRTWFRQQFGPYTLPSAANELRELIDRVSPNLVHAMRIPFEGMLAALAMKDIRDIPFMVSIWGNDFTLHATSSRKMSYYTRLTMERADALHTDTVRDQGNACKWGYNPQNPMIIQPCGGGIDLDVFYPADCGASEGPVTIINPRGIRAYLRNDTFFNSIPLVVNEHRDIRFLCPAMEGESQAESWINKLDIADFVELLPHQSNERMAKLYRQSQITVSISIHDGTPNSLLEAMACGSFPIVGDIESLKEWITQKENGILVNPGDPYQLAKAILNAIHDENLRSNARQKNIDLVRIRAEYQRKMSETHEFYKKIMSL